MIAETIPELGKLTPQEKLILAAELIGEYEATPQDTPHDAAIGRLLEARMEEYQLNPDKALSWEDFRKKWGMPLDE
jgi:putative addiction module component (TIGR02574 family)